MLNLRVRQATEGLMGALAHQPRARRQDFEENRKRILEAARLILVERGPEALTVSEVAHRAGLNRTTAYQHFRTRDALAEAVMDRAADDLLGMLRGPDVPWGQLDQLVSLFAEQPELARLTIQQLLSGTPLPKAGWRTYLRSVRKGVEREGARPDIDTEMLAYLVMCAGVLWPLVAQAQFEDSASARRATRRFSRELRRLLMHGILDSREEAGQRQKPMRRKRAPKSKTA